MNYLKNKLLLKISIICFICLSSIANNFHTTNSRINTSYSSISDPSPTPLFASVGTYNFNTYEDIANDFNNLSETNALNLDSINTDFKSIMVAEAKKLGDITLTNSDINILYDKGKSSELNIGSINDLVLDSKILLASFSDYFKTNSNLFHNKNTPDVLEEGLNYWTNTLSKYDIHTDVLNNALRLVITEGINPAGTLHFSDTTNSYWIYKLSDLPSGTNDLSPNNSFFDNVVFGFMGQLSEEAGYINDTSPERDMTLKSTSFIVKQWLSSAWYGNFFNEFVLNKTDAPKKNEPDRKKFNSLSINDIQAKIITMLQTTLLLPNQNLTSHKNNLNIDPKYLDGPFYLLLNNMNNWFQKYVLPQGTKQGDVLFEINDKKKHTQEDYNNLSSEINNLNTELKDTDIIKNNIFNNSELISGEPIKTEINNLFNNITYQVNDPDNPGRTITKTTTTNLYTVSTYLSKYNDNQNPMPLPVKKDPHLFLKIGLPIILIFSVSILTAILWYFGILEFIKNKVLLISHKSKSKYNSFRKKRIENKEDKKTKY